MALRGMVTGNGTETMWHTLACSLNVAMILAEHGVEPQGMSAIKSGQAALVRVKHHAETIGTWHLGIHAFAIECAFKAHDMQVQGVTKAQLTAALHEVYRRIEAGQVLAAPTKGDKHNDITRHQHN
jgi:hypothetical protein